MIGEKWPNTQNKTNPRKAQWFLVCVPLSLLLLLLSSSWCQGLFWVFPPLTPVSDTFLQLTMSFHSSHWSIAGTSRSVSPLVFSIFNRPREIRLFPRSLSVRGREWKDIWWAVHRTSLHTDRQDESSVVCSVTGLIYIKVKEDMSSCRTFLYVIVTGSPISDQVWSLPNGTPTYKHRTSITSQKVLCNFTVWGVPCYAICLVSLLKHSSQG